MNEIIVKIGDISTKNVKIRKFLFEQFMNREPPCDPYRSAEENYGLSFGSTITLKFPEKCQDSLIQYSDELCKLQIENGTINSIKHFRSVKEIITEYKEKYPDKENSINVFKGKTLTLRDKLQAVVVAITEAKKGKGSATKEEIHEKLEEVNIKKEEADKLIKQLCKDGMIYSPEPNHFKLS